MVAEFVDVESDVWAIPITTPEMKGVENGDNVIVGRMEDIGGCGPRPGRTNRVLAEWMIVDGIVDERGAEQAFIQACRFGLRLVSAVVGHPMGDGVIQHAEIERGNTVILGKDIFIQDAYRGLGELLLTVEMQVIGDIRSDGEKRYGGRQAASVERYGLIIGGSDIVWSATGKTILDMEPVGIVLFDQFESPECRSPALRIADDIDAVPRDGHIQAVEDMLHTEDHVHAVMCGQFTM